MEVSLAEVAVLARRDDALTLNADTARSPHHTARHVLVLGRRLDGFLANLRQTIHI